MHKNLPMVPAVEATQKNASKAGIDAHGSNFTAFHNFEKQVLEHPQEDGSVSFSNNPNLNCEHTQMPSQALPGMDACKSGQSTVVQSSNSSEGAVGDEIQNQLPATSEVTTEDIATAEHKRRTTERREPVRSSERTRNKVLPSSEILILEEKTFDTKHFCIYCRLAVPKLSKHLENKHAEETDVAHAIHFPKGSKVRQTLLQQICKRGDYEYGQIFKKALGHRVGTKQTAPNCDFLPCQHCFTLHRNADLWSHEQSCKARTKDVPPSLQASTSGSSSLSEFLNDNLREIIHVVHQDELCQRIRNDPLICKFGSALSLKCDHNKSQFPHIAQKMGELAQFTLAVNGIDKGVQYLHEICLLSKFHLAVEGARRACAFAPSDEHTKCHLISNLGHSLKKAAEIAFGESRMTEDNETENEVKGFIQLLDTKWSECFFPNVGTTSSNDEVKKLKGEESTVTEDLMKLHRYVNAEEISARIELREKPSILIWKRLSEATLADVCLFNRGRVGNVGRMLLRTYTHKKNTGTCQLTADQIRKNSRLELELCGGFTRLELEGQYGRNVMVLLTEKMVLLIDLLINYREDVSVSKTNTYLFARSEGPSFIRGLDCIRKTAVECGVKNPEALLSPSLREQIACCWQLMSLRECELDHVAKLLGRCRKDFLRLSNSSSEMEQVCKELLQMDRTLPSQVSGNTKGGTVLKTPVKRRPWSEREQAAVKRYLCDFITKMKVPGKKECNACIAAEPDLVGRTWTDIKNYVHNTLQTMRRRKKQGKPEDVHNLLTGVKDNQIQTKSTKEKSNAETEELLQDNYMAMVSSSQYCQEMSLGFTAMCSSNMNTVRPVVASFTPLNATDTQVVPTYSPLNTTNAIMSLPPSLESNILPMTASYTQNVSNVHLPPVTDNSVFPSYSALNIPNTRNIPTYGPLSSPSTSFSFLPASQVINSSMTPLHPQKTHPYPHTPHMTSAAQVVPTVPGSSGSDVLPSTTDSTCEFTPQKVASVFKPQKRHKRLWTIEEQVAVRRQLGDFCKLLKIPGKKECDACLEAEPALGSRTWREVKYFVHNSIQSMRRRGVAVASIQMESQYPEAVGPNIVATDNDGPVYLSL